MLSACYQLHPLITATFYLAFISSHWLLSLSHKVSTLFQHHPLTLYPFSAAAETSLSSFSRFPASSSRSLIFHLSTGAGHFQKSSSCAPTRSSHPHKSHIFLFPSSCFFSSEELGKLHFGPKARLRYQTLAVPPGRGTPGKRRWSFGMAELESEGVWHIRVCSPHLSGAVARGSPSHLAAADSLAPGLSEVPLIRGRG